ncbi:MAG: CHAT domain-containing protein [Candidatus Bathyarchaeales archaeon]
MSEIAIRSVKEPGAKKCIEISFRRPMSSQRFEERLSFSRHQQKITAKFINAMDDFSCRARAYRRQKNEKKLKAVNKNAEERLKRYGKKLFKILSGVRSVRVKNFEDIFGEGLSTLTLNLDNKTRRFPWELAYDGQDFLCTKYEVGRTWIVQKANYLSGNPPLSKKALVIGLNYTWADKDNWLNTPKVEALQVKRRLEKLGYSPILLRDEEATKERVMDILSKHVSVFHFSGHGQFLKNQPEGKKGRLILYDNEVITEDDFRECFRRAGGAPYLVFINACQSAKEIYNSHLIDAFLENGAESIVGTVWSVYDHPSRDMAIKFYDKVVEGWHFGAALYSARQQILYSRKKEDTLTWPAFVLYGDPNNTLPEAP